MKPELHLFDFDGTITRKDSLLDFAEFVVGTTRSKFYLALVSPVISLMKLGILKRADAKVMFLKLHFKGRSSTELSTLARSYLQHSIQSGLLREKALEQIKNVQLSGHRVCIVSASLDFWLQPFAEHFNADLLCTRGAFQDEQFTGWLDGENCNYQEKASRILAQFNLSEFSRVVAYGDSKGDQAMFDLADEHFFRPFE